MDCRAVLIFLCVLIAQAGCRPVSNGANTEALKETIQLMQTEIWTTLKHLDCIRQAAPGLLPNLSCMSLNTTKLMGLEEEPVTARSLSFFRCYMMELSELTPELSTHLQITSQYAQNMEQLMNATVSQQCTLPSFEQELDSYVYAKCLLQLLDQRLRKAKF